METGEGTGGDCWALVPLKVPGTGKRRLAPVLDAAGRAHLVRSLFAQVLGALRSTPEIGHIAVVTPDPAFLPAGVLGLTDSTQDINETIARAAQQISARGGRRLLVLPADLPCVEPAEISALITASLPGGFAIAPDRRECGTNALCFTLPANFRFQFGADSFAKHLAEAAALGRKAAVVREPGLAFDVDEPEDLARLRRLTGNRFALECATGT